MNRPVAIILSVVGWVAVVVTLNFSKIVPHASESEVRPFIAPVVIFALVATVVAIRAFVKAPEKG
jgi:hypothetical protein